MEQELYSGAAGRLSETLVDRGKRFDHGIMAIANQRPSSLENTLAHQIPLRPEEFRERKLVKNTVAPLREEENKVYFQPLNPSYKKVFAQLPEEITHENFGVVKQVEGGLGSRNDLSHMVASDHSLRLKNYSN
jgi:hypothetical protein